MSNFDVISLSKPLALQLSEIKCQIFKLHINIVILLNLLSYFIMYMKYELGRYYKAHNVDTGILNVTTY